MRVSFIVALFLLLIGATLMYQSDRRASSSLDSIDRLAHTKENLDEEYFAQVANHVKKRLMKAELPSYIIPKKEKTRIQVLMTLSADGELRGLTLKESTQSKELDAAVLEVIENAQPFPTAPEALVHDDNVYVGWSADFSVGPSLSRNESDSDVRGMVR